MERFVLYRNHNWDEDPPDGLALVGRFRTYDTAEAVAIGYFCIEDRSGTFGYEIHEMDGWQVPDAATYRGAVKLMVGLIWRGQPGDWHGGNGVPKADLCTS